MDRAPSGWVAPMRLAASNSSPSANLPVLHALSDIIISTGGGSILILPILSYRRPTGIESCRSENHLAAKELPPETDGRERLIRNFRPVGIPRYPIRQGRFVLRWMGWMADRLSDRMAAWPTDFLPGCLPG